MNIDIFSMEEKDIQNIFMDILGNKKNVFLNKCLSDLGELGEPYKDSDPDRLTIDTCKISKVLLAAAYNKMYPNRSTNEAKIYLGDKLDQISKYVKSFCDRAQADIAKQIKESKETEEIDLDKMSKEELIAYINKKYKNKN